MKRFIQLAGLTLLGACAVEPSKAPESKAPAPRRTASTFEFEAVIDPSKGSFELMQPDGTTGTTLQGLQDITVVQDGTAGSGPMGTVELVTTGIGNDGACGFASSFCGTITVRSFFGSDMAFVYAELTNVTPAAGHGPLNADPPKAGLSNTLGLWSYGTLQAGSARSRQWVFADDGTSFHVRGRIVADFPTASYEVSTDFGASFNPVTLPDAGWGCDGCTRFYRTFVPFDPSAVTFAWGSDNRARLFVNGSIVFDTFFLGGFCSDQPCCSRCCDTAFNCLNSHSDVYTDADFNFAPSYNGGSNEFLWEVEEEFGGDGFYTEMVFTP